MATQLVINELSPAYMTANFMDENGDAVVPTTVDWRVDRKDGTEVVAWTAVGTPAASTTILIPGSNHTILDSTNPKEEFIFTVRVDDGLSTEGYEDMSYSVRNLRGVS